MRRSPLLAVGFVLTVLGVALLLKGMQRDVEAAQASPFGLAVPSWIGGGDSPAPAPPTSGSTETRDAEPARSTARLEIPSIGLERPVSPGGLSADGTIDPTPGTVMWFDGNDRVPPGEIGTSVVAAHVSVDGEPDVFARLSEVEVGDVVQITKPNGAVTEFSITTVTAMPKDQVTTDQSVWGVNTEEPRLAIVTCDDAFGFRGDGHRVANLVVIAERR